MKATTILSTKLTSQNMKNASLAGFIDKIELNAKSLSHNLKLYQDHLDSIEVKYELGQFRKGRQHFLSITPQSGNKVYILYSWKTKDVYRFILNPSEHTTYDVFIQSIGTLLGSIDKIESLTITRLDKTIDIALFLNEITRGLLVKHKRYTHMYSFESGGFTGINLGKNDEVIKIYNRNKKTPLIAPCTRIEIQCKGSKIAFPTLHELKVFWKTNSNPIDHSFKHISLNNVTILESTNKKTSEISTFLSRLPYMFVRSMLNTNSNFTRDYGKIHTLTPWKLQPAEIFNTGMRTFFNTNDSEAKS
jgi:hypothetical protein